MAETTIIADVLLRFVRPRGEAPSLHLDTTKGKLPIILTREQAIDLAHIILEELE